MTRLLASSLAAVFLGLLSVVSAITKPEADEGWIALYDGESSYGWTAEPAAAWRSTAGHLVPPPEGGRMRSNSAFSDFTLKVEYRATAGELDCGVILRTALEGDPRQTGYQVQIGDAHPEWPTGSVVDSAKARPLRPELNQWHTLEMTASGDHLAVRLDGYPVSDVKNLRSRSGFVVLACGKSAPIQFRALDLRPLEAKALFNGTDLAGWKVVAPPAPPKEGLFKRIIPGGDGPKEAVWTVVNRQVHVEKGSGRLETAAAYDDFLLQMTLRMTARDRNDPPKASVFFRGDAGQLSSGYEVVGGGLPRLQAARKPVAAQTQFFTQTIAVRDRHIQIWIDGVPVTDFQDSRAEGTQPQRAARTAGGTISLEVGDEKTVMDVRSVRVVPLPKPLGKVAAPPPGVIPVAPPVAVPSLSGAAVAPAPSVADIIRPQVQALMTQALSTSDPAQQADLYRRILALDANNQVAFTGLQQAQQKIAAANESQQKDAAAKQQATQAAEKAKQDGESALQRAEDALVNGNILAAQAALVVATRLLPADSRVASLRSRIDSAASAGARMRYMLTGAGAVVVIGALLLFIRGRALKVPYLEVVDGPEPGRRYALGQSVIRIGAIAQDGAERNEIVIRDPQRRVSRAHCEIHINGREIFLIDNGSANGTFVESRRLEPSKPLRIKPGTRIDLAGTCVLKLGMQRKPSKQS